MNSPLRLLLVPLFVACATATPEPAPAWTAIPAQGAPTARQGATAVWTGEELIVWGGFTDEGDRYDVVGTGGRYDLRAGTWRPLPAAGAPSARAWHTAIWTGTEMIVWGGAAGDTMSGDTMNADGFAYDPAKDRWRPIATEGAPRGRVEHSAVWTGTEMLVVAGVQEEVSFTGGGRYDPATDSWKPLAAAEFLTGSRAQAAVWAGAELIVFGGINGGRALQQGGRYDPDSDSWKPISLKGAPGKRGHPGMVWTGERMVVFGGARGVFDGPPAPGGGIFDPKADAWAPLPTDGAPSDRLGHAMVWTGRDVVIWGGGACHSSSDEHGPCLADGARWRPGDESWTALDTAGAPSPRAHAATAWTGAALVVWGGIRSQMHRDGGVLALASKVAEAPQAPADEDPR